MKKDFFGYIDFSVFLLYYINAGHRKNTETEQEEDSMKYLLKLTGMAVVAYNSKAFEWFLLLTALLATLHLVYIVGAAEGRVFGL